MNGKVEISSKKYKPMEILELSYIVTRIKNPVWAQ